MLAFLALLLHPAAAQDPLRVGPHTGDFPTFTAPPTLAPGALTRVAGRVVGRVDWARFGPLPVKRHFAAEIAASARHVAPLPLAEPPTDPLAEPPTAP